MQLRATVVWGRPQRGGAGWWGGPGIAVFCLALGILVGAGGLWLLERGRRDKGDSERVVLDAATQAVMASVSRPVTIHFFVGLEDPAVVEEERVFARRVEALLRACVEAGGSRIQLRRHEVRTVEDQQAAVQAGIQPFHLERGGAAYLGLVIESGERRQVLARLDPAWERALEFDVARAVQAVVMEPRGVGVVEPTEQERAALSEVRALLGEVESVSLEDGARRLREAALQEFRRAAESFGARQEELRRRFQEAEQRSDAGAQQALLEELRRLQAEQTAAFQRLAERLQVQLEAWNRFKGSTGIPSAVPSTSDGSGPLPEHAPR